MTTRFPHGFSPIRIGTVDLKNRIFVPAHTANYGVDHLPSERHVHYHHAEKARGGVGLIIFEAIRVHPSSIGRALGVTLQCGVEATAERVVAFRPDAVVIATGARPKAVTIPGALASTRRGTCWSSPTDWGRT